MAQYPASFALSSLNATTGYVFRPGADGTYYGISIAAAGDVNGDGQTDYLIGESDYHPRSLVAQAPTLAGQTHLVFGGASNLAAMDLLDGVADGAIDQSLITATYGYKFKFNVVGDGSGVSVEGAGQVDNVAGDDFLIGTPRSTATPGVAHFVSGGSNLAVLDAADGSVDGQILLTNVNGSTGYQFNGTSNGDRNGYTVGSVADMNNDGFRDLLIGSYLGDAPGATNSGIVGLVFGSPSNLSQLDIAGGTPADGVISIANLNGTTGYRFAGAAADFAGVSLAGMKDVDGDGIADLIIGAQQQTLGGESFVVFGGAANLAALDIAGGAAADGLIALTAVNGTTGYRFKTTDDDQFGWSVSGAGDVNADGLEDLLIGDPFGDAVSNNGGHAYLIFGGTTNLSALDAADGVVDGSITADNVDGTTGFRLGGAGGQWMGHSVSAVGDVNGDGYDDVALGANFRNARAGAAYIMFGGAAGNSGFNIEDAADGAADGKINLTSFSGVGGMRIDGVAASDQAGFDVARIGDVNSDGLADMMLSSVRDQAAIAQQDTGEVYIVYSRLPDAAVNRTGTGIGQTLVGGDFNDTLSGMGGDDVLISGGGGGVSESVNGGAGNDTLLLRHTDIAAFSGTLDGGADTDTLRIEGGAVDVSAATMLNIENVGFTGSGASLIRMTDAQGDGLSFTGRAGLVDRVVVEMTATALDYSGTTFSDMDSFSFYGTAGADTVTGTSIMDFFYAGSGGADTLAGGDGNDRYYIDQAGVTVIEDANEGTDSVYASVNYSLSDNVETLLLTGASGTQGIGNGGANTIHGNGGANNLQGLAGADSISGGGDNDTIDGGADNDRLQGDAGDDRLIGGGGRDALWGGDGDDTFFLYDTTANLQKIYDFVLGEDKFEISEALFGQDFGAGPTLSATAFRNNTTGKAQDADDHFIYNSANGALYFDADGTGAGVRVQIASLTASLTTLSASDFLLA